MRWRRARDGAGCWGEKESAASAAHCARNTNARPSRYALSTACASAAGFHDASYMTTRSAAVRVSPNAPTPEDSKNKGMSGGEEDGVRDTPACAWKRATRAARSAAGTAPSMRRRGTPAVSKEACSASSSLVDWEKRSVLCPAAAADTTY